MRYGLSEETIESILGILKKSPKVEEAVLFGSRAKGNYRPGSDIDIAIKGKELLFDDFLNLTIKLDELELANKVDLVNYETIENPDFIEHIKRVGICLFRK